MVDCLLTILVNQICRLFSTHQTPDSIIALSLLPQDLKRISNYISKIGGDIFLSDRDLGGNVSVPLSPPDYDWNILILLVL